MAFSRNQYVAIKNVYKHFLASCSDAILLTEGDSLEQETFPVALLYTINLFDALLIICLIILRIPSLIKTSRAMDKRVVRNYLSDMLLVYFYLYVSLLLFSPKGHKLIVMSNDHNPLNRCILMACYSRNIISAFVPHAFNSDLFLPCPLITLFYMVSTPIKCI